jgi:voltage-gated potassium channel
MESSPKTNISYELFIGSLGIFSLFLLACYFLPLEAPTKDVAYIVNNFIALIFLFDFFYGWWNAPGKLSYLKTGWLTLLGGIPLLPLFALFRLWRVTNLIRYMRVTGQHRFIKTLLHSPANSVLLSTFFLAIVVVTISSMFVVSYEVESPSSNIKTGPDALWWSLVTVATVGYGDRYPVTTGGRLIGVTIMVVGVGLFGVLSSFLASKFIRHQKADEPDSKQEIAALREQIAALQRSIDRLMPQSPASQNQLPDTPQNSEPA